MKQVFTMEQIKAMQRPHYPSLIMDVGEGTVDAPTKRFVFQTTLLADDDREWLANYFQHTGKKQPLSYQERIELGDCEE